MTSTTRVSGFGPAGCPPGYVRHATSCYRFENQTKNWIDAEKHCQTTHPDSHLIAIETPAEMDAVITYRAHNNARWSSRYIWTGGNDMASEGHWTWVGTGRVVGGPDGAGYTDWLPGQPDNHNGDQHCLYARADGSSSSAASSSTELHQHNRSAFQHQRWTATFTHDNPPVAGQPGTGSSNGGGAVTAEVRGGRWDDWHCHAARLNFVCELLVVDK
jgi:hypothetical protein